MVLQKVQLILGVAEISLNRQGLELGERGGFEARWAEGEGTSLEAFQQQLKVYLNEVYKKKYHQDAPKITLNLASHQLIEDIIGWSKLNYSSKD